MLRLLPLFAYLLLASCESKKATTTAERTQPDTADTAAAPPAQQKAIIFFGNSLAAGYGLDNTADAFPNRIGARIDSLGLPYRVINAGLSGETTAGGRSRIGWILKNAGRSTDIFVLELGGNDGLRGISLTSTRENLQAIIDTVRLKNPEARVVIAGMQIPPNLGRTYAQEFRQLFKELADKN
jgi:acyl-CoA thioesterase I